MKREIFKLAFYLILILLCGGVYILWRNQSLSPEWEKFFGYYGLHAIGCLALSIGCGLTAGFIDDKKESLVYLINVHLGIAVVSTVIESLQLLSTTRRFDIIDIAWQCGGLVLGFVINVFVGRVKMEVFQK